MFNVPIKLIKELRKRTGIGILECKKNLLKSKGNLSKAIDNLRKSGKVKAFENSHRIANEGIILTKISQDKKLGVILEINCETDFVSKDKEFIDFGKFIINKILSDNIYDINVLNNKFEENIIYMINKFNENIKFNRLKIIQGDMISSYLHHKKIGVVVSSNINNNEKLMKYIAMHIAASKPRYIDPDNIPKKILSKEYKIQLEIALKLNKPIKIAKKIVEGRIYKFVREISLTGQNFILDLNKNVGQILQENNIKINNYIRFEIGENI